MNIFHSILAAGFEQRFLVMVFVAAILIWSRKAWDLYVASFTLLLAFVSFFEINVLSDLDRASAFYSTLSSLAFFVVLFVFSLVVSIPDSAGESKTAKDYRLKRFMFSDLSAIDVVLSILFMACFISWSFVSHSS
jgi:hypothetical protein